MNRQLLAGLLVGLLAGSLVGCTATPPNGDVGAGTPVTVTVTTTIPSSTPQPEHSTASSPNPTSTTPSPAVTSAPAGPCTLIAVARATVLLGAKPAITTPSPRQQPAGVRLIDGCYYGTADARNSLTYNVYDVAGLGATAAAGDVAGFRQQVAGVPGAVAFPVSLGETAAGAVSPQGGAWLAQIEFAKGARLVRVDSVRAKQADARAVVMEAARELVPALS